MRTSREMAAFSRALLVAGGLAAASAALPAAAQTTAQKPVVALDPANRDETCAPCNDFYKYANGGWLATAKIPASYAGIGAFRELRDKNEAALHDIMDAAVANMSKASAGSNQCKLAAYYGTCMDSAAAEAHFAVMTSSVGAESCAVCHDTGRDLATSLVHKIR